MESDPIPLSVLGNRTQARHPGQDVARAAIWIII